MKNLIVLLTILSLFSNSVTASQQQQKLWPTPSELATNSDETQTTTDSKISWACSFDPNAPPSPPGSFPNIPPGFPHIPGFPQSPPTPQTPRIQAPPNPQTPGFQIPPFPQIPGFPQIPIPQITIPPFPQITIPPFPQITIPPFPQITIPGFPQHPGSIGGEVSLSLSQSEMEKCLSKNAEKCFSQIFTSYAENDFVLDKECCEVVMKMENKCNDHIHFLFKTPYFAPLLQYSCHIKHATKN